MRIGEVAARAGVNVQTLRFYERRGLLKRPVRLSSGYRSYDDDAVKVVRFIKRTQEFGFTLTEIKLLLDLRDDSSRDPDVVRGIAQVKVAAIEERIGRLKRIRADLVAMLASCKCRDRKSQCALASF